MVLKVTSALVKGELSDFKIEIIFSLLHKGRFPEIGISAYFYVRAI